MRLKYVFFLFIIVGYFFTACKNGDEQTHSSIFISLEHDKTGLDFNNALTPSDSLNMFNYMYFYNGGGVGAGDFNNDGLIDLFFASNQGDNKLYLNTGRLTFKDITKDAHIPQDHGWSTGISVVDVNNDGLLDIYVCKVGQFKNLHSGNQLLLCKEIKNGIPIYEDVAQQYGLRFSGFSTQAAFLDYDMDGDLDMYLLNHTVHQDGSFAPRSRFTGTYDSLGGDRLYRNDGNHFTDVTKSCGINSSAIGYGLGIAVADINLDGWPDIYIGNDFHENDYLYINQKNGTFKDENTERIMHTSKFSMGVDIADANNDGYPEIITVDMLPDDPYILKRSLGDDDYDVFWDKIRYGYSYQYSRNMLQYNRRNGMFSETGLYSGVYATDWSWAPLWMDFDNDGKKDLFISNGIPKRLNDMDYVNFIYNSEIRTNHIKKDDIDLLKKYPEIKTPNRFFRNINDLKFDEIGNSVGDNPSTFSNGAVYADFDNDGDLDIVVNNINDYAILYENKTSAKNEHSAVNIKLNGPPDNRNAIGAKVLLCSGGNLSTYEKNAARGFMSSMETPLHIGLKQVKVDSAFLVWPDNSFQKIALDTAQPVTSIAYTKGLPSFDYEFFSNFNKSNSYPAHDITASTQINFLHKENLFNEFTREPLMPHMVSAEGPALAVGDINHDGLEDVFIGGAKTFHGAVFLQQPGGKFIKKLQPALVADSMYEDVDARFADVNNDGNIDLLVASGGNEFYGLDKHLLPRLYLNDGKANFIKSENAFDGITSTTSCIVTGDFNGDGFMDVFVGGRAMPWNYGEIPTSYLLQNDGNGKFVDVTKAKANELSNIGMVTGAVYCDIDNDGDGDLVVSCEWGTITAFINDKGSFTKKQLTNRKGWWNCIIPVDIDKDGDIDFVAGNLGLNSRLHASEQQPVRMYFNDFDDNGKKEQVLTYYIGGKEIPFASKDELQKQMPVLKKKYMYAEDFAGAKVGDLFPPRKIDSAALLTADYFANALLINDGKNNFALQQLPWQAQLSSIRDAAIIYRGKDSLPEILPGANYYYNNIASGRYDADFGTLLVNNSSGQLTAGSLNGLVIRGEVRRIASINIAGKQAYILARNNDSAMVIQFNLPSKNK
ncbi:MAG: VCBS repeat-containing protein [Chitinophagaceae bacterium]|nr:VCBS repeat-containing protein [Chitinophagaceae bacterium]